jgi:hypothetical protein
MSGVGTRSVGVPGLFRHTLCQLVNHDENVMLEQACVKDQVVTPNHPNANFIID